MAPVTSPSLVVPHRHMAPHRGQAAGAAARNGFTETGPLFGGGAPLTPGRVGVKGLPCEGALLARAMPRFGSAKAANCEPLNPSPHPL